MEPPAKRKREDQPAFVASPRFTGARDCYVFTTRALGTGYYSTVHSVQPPSQAQPAAGQAKLDGAQLLAEAEAAAGASEAYALDERYLRKTVVALERRLKENTETRARFADAPARYLESEVELHAELKRLGQCAAAPELLPELVRLGAVPTLLALLGHENADVAAEAVETLRELTSPDAAAESESALAGGAALAQELLGPQSLPLLLAALSRFDGGEAAEEQAAVNGLLGVFENLTEVSPDAARAALLPPSPPTPPLLASLLARVRGKKGALKQVDENRSAAAELIAVLLSGGREADSARASLGEADGVDCLLRAISHFRALPSSGDGGSEAEFLENVFDALCSAMMLPANRRAFVAAEGVELMLMAIRAKGAAKSAALKALDFSLTRCPPAALRIVDAGGLGALFAALSGRSAAAARKARGAEAAASEEQRSVSILSGLFSLLPLGCEQRARLASKFVESDCEKVDRLGELWAKYAARLAAAEREAQEAGETEEEEEEERYARRLEAGLFTLQQLASAIAELHLHAHPAVNQRLATALRLAGAAREDVRGVLRENAAGLGDGGGIEGDEAEELEGERERLTALIENLYGEGEVRPVEEEGRGACSARAAQKS